MAMPSIIDCRCTSGEGHKSNAHFQHYEHKRAHNDKECESEQGKSHLSLAEDALAGIRTRVATILALVNFDINLPTLKPYRTHLIQAL